MKYIKTFENQEFLTIGTFVVCSNPNRANSIWTYETLPEYVNSIGTIKSIEEEYYKVMYGSKGKNFIHFVETDEILFWSKNLKDCIIYIDANKYNL